MPKNYGTIGDGEWLFGLQRGQRREQHSDEGKDRFHGVRGLRECWSKAL